MGIKPPHITGSELLGEGRFLRLEKLSYCDRHGKTRPWETAVRQGNQGAVLLIPVLMPSRRYVIIRQYRPPVAAEVIEFPAGLIDPGEAVDTAAVRELREETGFIGEVRWLSRPTGSSAGMTGETVVLAYVEIDETLAENRQPRQDLDEGEDIQTHLVPIECVGSFFAEAETSGAILDSRTAAYFIGLGIRW